MSLDTIGDIKTEVGSLLKDSGHHLVTEAEIVDWWYEAEKKYAKATGMFIKNSTSGVVTVKGVREYSLPSDFIKMLAVCLLTDCAVTPDTTFDGTGTTIVWATSPAVVHSGNTLVKETFTLTCTEITVGEYGPTGYIFSVVGSVSGTQVSSYNCTNDDAYTTATIAATGIGGGLTFAFDISEIYGYVTVGDTIEIDVDPTWSQLEQTDMKELDASGGGWRTQVDEPTKYYVNGTKMGFDYMPDAVYGVRLDYAYIPAKVSDDGTAPNVPPVDREEMLNWVLHKAWFKRRDYEKAAAFKQLFRYDVDEAVVEQKARRDRPCTITYRYKHGWRR